MAALDEWLLRAKELSSRHFRAYIASHRIDLSPHIFIAASNGCIAAPQHPFDTVAAAKTPRDLPRGGGCRVPFAPLRGCRRWSQRPLFYLRAPRILRLSHVCEYVCKCMSIVCKCLCVFVRVCLNVCATSSSFASWFSS